MVELKDQLNFPQTGEYVNMDFVKPKKTPSPRIRNPNLHINTGISYSANSGGGNQIKTIHSAPAMAPTEKSPTKGGKTSPNNPLIGKIQTFFTGGGKSKNSAPPAGAEPPARNRQHSGPSESPAAAVVTSQPRSRRSYPGPGPILHQNASDSRLPTISAEPVTLGPEESALEIKRQQQLDYASLELPANPSASQSGFSPSHGSSTISPRLNPAISAGNPPPRLNPAISTGNMPPRLNPAISVGGNPPQFVIRDSDDSVSYAEIDLAKSEGLKKAASNVRS